MTFPQKLLAHEAMLRDVRPCLNTTPTSTTKTRNPSTASHLTETTSRSYNIRSAKCSIERDRDQIEEHVAELFDGLEDPILAVAVDATDDCVEVVEGTDEIAESTSSRSALRSVTSYLDHDQCLDEFNDYVRYSLRDMLVADLGVETQLSFSHCFLLSLPNVLSNIVQIWASRQLHKKLGYVSEELFFAASYVDTIFSTFIFSCFPPCLHLGSS